MLTNYKIISAGRLVPWKGFKMLIELMPDIIEIRNDVTLTIVGDGPERAKLEELVKFLNLHDKVKFLGNISRHDVLALVKASDLFVLNTGYEGLSHQLLEVMDIGIPIITTRVGGNPELIENGRDGLLVEYNNPGELLAAIRELIGAPGRARVLARNAREKLKQFDPEIISAQLAEIL